MSGGSLLFIAGLFFAVVHGSVKFLPRLPVYEIVFLRAVISAGLTYFALRHLKLSPWGKNKPMLILRGLAGTLALVLYFRTLQTMPMASAVTIQYLHPILTTILAGYFLREKPSWVQWMFFACSFAGVLLVKGFDTRVSGLELGIGVVSAFFSACAYTLVRALRHEDNALVVVFYLPLVSLFIVGPFTMAHWVAPTAFEWVLIVVIGLATQAAQYFMTRAYQKETAANISNLNYLGIIYAMAIGAAFFSETVELLSLLGMGVIAGSAILSTRFKTRPSA